MAKKRVICPECGHHHTIHFDGVRAKRAGVRSKRIGNHFEYTITAPDEMLETERFYNASDDVIPAACFAACCGIVAGGVVSSLLPAHLPNSAAVAATVQTMVIWFGVGGTIAYGWLCAEHNTRLKKVLPYFAKMKDEWAAGRDMSIGGNVKLTIDHRYRDSRTEAGRTVNRFGVLPVDLDRFNEWAQGALVGKSLAVSQWTPQAKGFTRPEYDKLLDKMTAAGVVANLGSNKGNSLTGGGRRALTRHLADCGIAPPSPVSETDFLGERLALAKETNGGNTPLPRPRVRAGGENGA